MKKYAGDGNDGQVIRSAVALLFVAAVGCSDDADDAAAAGSGGTAGAAATAGASGAAGAGGAPPVSGGAGGTPAAGGSGGASGAAAGGNGGNGLSGSGGGAAGSSTASVDAGTGLGNGAGDRQRCETATSCLEFRGHSPTCQVSNEANCANVSNGTYLVGPCPTDEFEFAGVEETFCGPTATFLRVDP